MVYDFCIWRNIMEECTFFDDLNNFAKTKNNNIRNEYGTHMPYLFYDKENNKKLLFDVKINNVWKLHIYDFATREIKQVKTPTSKTEEMNECNPNIYIDNKKNYILSYVAAPDRFRLSRN